MQRVFRAALVLTLIATACGISGDDEGVPTTIPTASSTTTTTTRASATNSTATHVPPRINPIGNGSILGSGCAPSADELPYGVWLAWSWPCGNQIEFDLACLSLTENGPFRKGVDHDVLRRRSPIALAGVVLVW
jgi:hypothetical protein